MLKPNEIPKNNDLTSNLKMFIESFVRDDLDNMLPCQVISHDRVKNRVDIKVLIMLKTTAGEKISRQVIRNIPVFRFGGGGFFFSVPIKAGDFGWIKANDRDISLMFQSGGKEDIPNTKRLHKFNDGLFFPDTLKEWVINGKNAEAVVISSMDGASCIAIDKNRIEIDTTDLIINATNVQINGSTLKHNSKNVGDTHTHPQNAGDHFGGGVDTSAPNA